ncbi:MAG: hypothetical protein V7K67_11065 [Nostoc sp.]
MPIEFIGMIGTRQISELDGPTVRRCDSHSPRRSATTGATSHCCLLV